MVIATIVPRYLDMERRAKQVLFGEFQDLHNLLRRYVTYVIRHSERCTREDPRERVLCPARGHKAKAATNTRIDNDHYHSWKNAEGVEDYSAGATRETTGQQEQGSGHCSRERVGQTSCCSRQARGEVLRANKSSTPRIPIRQGVKYSRTREITERWSCQKSQKSQPVPGTMTYHACAAKQPSLAWGPTTSAPECQWRRQPTSMLARQN